MGKLSFRGLLFKSVTCNSSGFWKISFCHGLSKRCLWFAWGCRVKSHTNINNSVWVSSSPLHLSFFSYPFLLFHTIFMAHLSHCFLFLMVFCQDIFPRILILIYLVHTHVCTLHIFTNVWPANEIVCNVNNMIFWNHNPSLNYYCNEDK